MWHKLLPDEYLYHLSHPIPLLVEMTQRNLGITLNDRVLAELDRARGPIPRSTAIQLIIQERLGIDSPSSQLAGVGDGE